MGAIVSLHGRELGFDTETGEIVRRNVRGGGGAIAGTATSAIATHYGDPALYLTVLTFSALSISISDDAGVAQYGGTKIFDFPAGLVNIFGAIVSGTLTGYASLIDTFEGGVALGTATATTGATLTGTEANIMPEVSVAAAVAEVATIDAVSVATALTEAGMRTFDGTATAIDAFLNFVIDDNAAHGAGTALFTGTVKFSWQCLGDN